MLNVERLRALAAVSTHGSIAGAAQALHVTPSGVSQQLGKLERETGHQLLEPHGRSVRLTQAGHVLAKHASRVVSQLAAAETDLADLRHEILGPLRIGAVGSALRALLPETLADLTAQHPRLVPTVQDGEAVDMVPQLLAGDLDLVLIESWANRPMRLPAGLSLQRLISEDVHVALSEQHRLADREVMDLADLTDTAWAACPPGTDPYDALVQAMRDHGVEPDICYTAAEYATILALVRTNLAAALVPTIAQQPSPPGVRFIPTRPALRRDIQAAWRSPTTSPAIRTCVAALVAAVAPGGPAGRSGT